MEVNDGDIMPTIAQSLKKLCEDNGIQDPDLVLDVYRCCNSHGTNQFIPDEELLDDVERTDPKYWSARSEIANRKEYLEEMAHSNYMGALLGMNDPMKAVLTFVEHLGKAYAAMKEAADKRGPITGAQRNTVNGYASATYLDNMLDAMRHARTQGMSFDDVLASITSYHEICDSEEISAFYSGCGLCTSYTASNYGGALAKAVVEKGETLPAQYPLLFKEFTRISEAIGSGNKSEVSSEDVEKKKRRDSMESYDQVASVDPTEMAKDNFDVNLAEKKMEVDHHLKEEAGICHLFVLLDVSGSMDCCDLGGRVGRNFAANVLTLACMRFGIKDKWKVWCVPFAGNVGTRHLQTCEDKDSTLKAMKWLGGQNYNGAGTDIERAVLWAYRQLHSDPTYRKADVVLITDGCSPISDAVIKNKPPRLKLRTLFVSDSLPYGGHAKRLCTASDTHQLVGWDNNKMEFVIGDALAGISDRHANDEMVVDTPPVPPTLLSDLGEDEDYDDNGGW